MATTRMAVTRDWALALAGAADINLNNPTPWALEYCTDTDLPTASEVGAQLLGGKTHPVRAAEGENIYVRVVDSSGAAAATVVMIDA